MRNAVLWLFIFCYLPAAAQTPAKQITDNQHVWLSVNSTMRFSERWGAIADVHVRRNNYIADPSFYFVRAGASYWLVDNLTLVAGYGHMWLASNVGGKTGYADENRIYQQIIYNSRMGKVSVLNRFRNEQRWRETLANQQSTGDFTFSNRLRYLISLGISVSKNPRFPQISIANEVAIQFGKSVVYNTFDQIRLFGGIRQGFGKGWSYDLGYMLLYQQGTGGNSYSRNHTVRLFFYYTLDTRKKATRQQEPAHHFEDE
ncbi:DUF2490 domain-containing protein [Chitinophaga deserti]|uniref:DUF2490 domain-containing protein n=1 Tax=Chitinophaga deserti TaxID=2164099 RepID=UPI000D6B4857|nr:DUF2490 domain-containing protein [Chitinophaga deserti]